MQNRPDEGDRKRGGTRPQDDMQRRARDELQAEQNRPDEGDRNRGDTWPDDDMQHRRDRDEVQAEQNRSGGQGGHGRDRERGGEPDNTRQ